MKHYDTWKTQPPEGQVCPECESPVDEDKLNRTADCTNPECDWSWAFDWDNLAERRQEAPLDDPGLDAA